jgi:hypothetical protein
MPNQTFSKLPRLRTKTIAVNLDRKSFRKVLAKKNFSKNFSKRL